MIKVDPALKSRCGYLVVPENRKKPAGRKVKIPFVYLRKPTDSSAISWLYTTGGPGYSTIANIDSIGAQSGWMQYGAFIAFDQRGTKKSVPCLDCPETGEAIKRAYRENLSRDSLVQQSVTQCRQKFVKQGIDLSAYNTIESAADINDLRKALHIDSLILAGISYSGGLMLTVVRNHPEGVKALVLNSPLPGFVNYEEHALFNYNEALEQVFTHCEEDSAGNALYANLRMRFHQYFTAITGKVFTIGYVENGKRDTMRIHYGKQELLDAVIDRLNTSQLKTVPFVITEIMQGHHASYVKEQLDGAFSGNGSLSYGMRLSIYCSEQIAWSDSNLVKKQGSVLPWLAGVRFNNVDHGICACWNVKPEPAIAKTPVYSPIPALISAGDADPWCPPFYNRLIRRTMPNAQLLIIHDRGHGAGFTVNGVDFLTLFLKDPYQKLVSAVKGVIIE
jgi:pimeloyl-ACP methyl ester carboxylesterase